MTPPSFHDNTCQYSPQFSDHCFCAYAEGKIRVEDIVKLASQTEENNEDEEESRH
jgi:hypothetical protein